MPDIEASLIFLEDLPLYAKEKPYHMVLAADETPLNSEELSNIEHAIRPVLIHDIRECDSHFSLT
jgi:hypothetical protein